MNIVLNETLQTVHLRWQHCLTRSTVEDKQPYKLTNSQRPKGTMLRVWADKDHQKLKNKNEISKGAAYFARQRSLWDGRKFCSAQLCEKFRGTTSTTFPPSSSSGYAASSSRKASCVPEHKTNPPWAQRLACNTSSSGSFARLQGPNCFRCVVVLAS